MRFFFLSITLLLLTSARADTFCTDTIMKHAENVAAYFMRTTPDVGANSYVGGKSRNSQRLVNHGKLHLRHRKTLLKILPAVPDYERRDKRAQRSPPRTRKGNSQSAQRSNGTGSRAVSGQNVIFRRLPHSRGGGRYSIPLSLQPLTHSPTLVQLVAAFGVAPCPSRWV